jgi:hypothetical protein
MIGERLAGELIDHLASMATKVAGDANVGCAGNGRTTHKRMGLRKRIDNRGSAKLRFEVRVFVALEYSCLHVSRFRFYVLLKTKLVRIIRRPGEADAKRTD